MIAARRTEPSAWLVAPRGAATLLEYVPACRTNIRARWQAAMLLPPAAPPAEACTARVIALRGAEQRPAA